MENRMSALNAIAKSKEAAEQRKLDEEKRETLRAELYASRAKLIGPANAIRDTLPSDRFAEGTVANFLADDKQLKALAKKFVTFAKAAKAEGYETWFVECGQNLGRENRDRFVWRCGNRGCCRRCGVPEIASRRPTAQYRRVVNRGVDTEHSSD